MSHLSTDEEKLLRELRAGNEYAFSEIYNRYWKSLYLFARNRLKSDEDALDITQDLFVKLWTRRDSLLISTSLSGYLFQSLKNKILDHIQATFTREDYAQSLQQTLPAFRDATEEKVLENEISALVSHSIAAMPSRMKEIFELSRHNGQSVAEISEGLQLSPQTVKNQISQAIKRVRIDLSDYLVSIAIVFLLS